MKQYRKLKEEKMPIINESIKIGKLTLENRVVMAPMAVGKATNDGTPTDSLIEFYVNCISQSKIGLVETEHCFVLENGRAGCTQLSLCKDDVIPYMKKLTSIVHSINNTKIFAQLSHAGNGTKPEYVGGTLYSSSNRIHPWMKQDVIPEPLSKYQIQEIVEAFGLAALRAKDSGFDGIEIHGAHGYLITQFISKWANKRDDEYGGTLHNRCRILKEIIDEIRNKVGEDYPISVRIGAIDQLEGGNTLDDAIQLAKWLEDWGVQMISVSGGMSGTSRKGWNGPGFYRDCSAEIKKAVNIPVMMTGAINEIFEAESILQNNDCDLIGVGRALLRNPGWASELK